MMLRAPHWLIFLLAFALKYAFDYILVPLSNKVSWIPATGDVWMALDVVSFIALHFWLFSIITGLRKHLPADLRPGLTFYFMGLAFIIVHYIAAVVWPFFLMRNDQTPSLTPWPLWFIVRFMIIFYHMGLAAYTLVLAEKRQRFPLIDLAAELFAFVFFMFGVWWLQPRVNQLAEEDLDISDDQTPLDQFR